VTGSWEVEPERVEDFAAAVEDVRARFEALRADAEELMHPSNDPRLGTSPVGSGLTDKFNNRLGGTAGLLEQLGTALARMDEFVGSAEAAAARYRRDDASGATGLRMDGPLPS
jgi:hypothetical protein